MAASELKPNISNVNLTKAKRSYFYILIIATQTKQILLKRYEFFYTCIIEPHILIKHSQLCSKNVKSSIICACDLSHV